MKKRKNLQLSSAAIYRWRTGALRVNPLYSDTLSYLPGPVAQVIASPTADPGVMSLIPSLSHTFLEIDHEIIPPLADSRGVVVIYKRKYVHAVLVKCALLCELTVST